MQLLWVLHLRIIHGTRCNNGFASIKKKTESRQTLTTRVLRVGSQDAHQPNHRVREVHHKRPLYRPLTVVPFWGLSTCTG